MPTPYCFAGEMVWFKQTQTETAMIIAQTDPYCFAREFFHAWFMNQTKHKQEMTEMLQKAKK